MLYRPVKRIGVGRGADRSLVMRDVHFAQSAVDNASTYLVNATSRCFPVSSAAGSLSKYFSPLPECLKAMFRATTNFHQRFLYHEELFSLSWPPIREARWRIPRSPKCRSVILAASSGSKPFPLSLHPEDQLSVKL